MPRIFRRKYYDLFSNFYDGFVALHSGDRGGQLREEFAAETGLKKGDMVLDICTGTGSLLLCLRRHVGAEGLILGIDFSMGMLQAAKSKTEKYPNIHLLQADAADLPFKTESLNLITCSHAFYELRGDTRERCLQEALRVLKKSGRFFMMEHDIPKNALIRILFYIRILSTGSLRAFSILKKEQRVFQRHFPAVEKLVSESGGSKIFACQKGGEAPGK